MMKHYTINKAYVVWARTFAEAVQKFHKQHPQVQVNDVLVAL